MEKLTETNWGRLFNQFRSAGFFIISASRKENPPEVNKRKTLKLKQELEDKCFRPIAVHGGWIEDEGLDTEKFVNETSFFVPLFFGNKQFSANKYDLKSTHIFYKWMFELGRKYEQESVLYCPPNGKPRYVQTTEKDYGEGPIKAGTHFERFNKVNHNQKDAKYYTDLVNPKYQGGYNQETGKFMKSPKRITFESIESSFKRVMKLTEENKKGYKPAKFVFNEPYILDTESSEYAWDYESMLDFLNNSSPEFTEHIEDYKDLEDYSNLKDWWDAHYDRKGMAMTCEYHSSLKDDVKECINEYNASKKVKNEDLPKIGDILDCGEENGYCWITVDASDWPGEYYVDDLEDELLYYLSSAPLYGISYGGEYEEDYKTGFNEDSGTFLFCWKTDALKAGAL